MRGMSFSDEVILEMGGAWRYVNCQSRANRSGRSVLWAAFLRLMKECQRNAPGRSIRIGAKHRFRIKALPCAAACARDDCRPTSGSRARVMARDDVLAPCQGGVARDVIVCFREAARDGEMFWGTWLRAFYVEKLSPRMCERDPLIRSVRRTEYGAIGEDETGRTDMTDRAVTDRRRRRPCVRSRFVRRGADLTRFLFATPCQLAPLRRKSRKSVTIKTTRKKLFLFANCAQLKSRRAEWLRRQDELRR